MNQYRQEWIDALRSGEYSQGRIHLMFVHKDGTGKRSLHCPWGVACEIYHKHHPEVSEWIASTNTAQRKNFAIVINDEEFVSYGYPIRTIYEFFGSTSKEMEIIAEMNDWKDKTFEDIADYIENSPHVE